MKNEDKTRPQSPDLCPTCDGSGFEDIACTIVCTTCKDTTEIDELLTPAEIVRKAAGVDSKTSLGDAVDRLISKNDKLKEQLKSRVDDVLDTAKADMSTLDDFIDYVADLRDPVQAKRVAKVCEWLGRAATYRAGALELTKTKAGGAAVAAESVAQSAIDAAKVGL